METRVLPQPKTQQQKQFETEFGYFTDNEYVITRPDTPRPWVNVICPGDYGIVVSQTGSGYSWRTHASLNRITRWNQDLICDDWGKFLYIRDEESGAFWSPAWKPVCAELESYECRHGFGYTKFISQQNGIRSELTLFVPPGEPLEIWKLTLTNLTSQQRKLSVWSYFEWNLGEGPDSHREFHKTFIETELHHDQKILLASKRLWTILNAEGQHWNRSWDYVAWHGVSESLKGGSGSKDSFVGAYGSFQNPGALMTGKYLGKTTGKWDDAVGSLCCEMQLAPDESKSTVWTLGAAQSKKEALALSKKYQSVSAADEAFDAARDFWKDVLKRSRTETPDAAFNLLANDWLKYQALSSRIWGRTGYYQAGGAFGYRDQLQDSQIFLHLEPSRTKKQILLHAAHQYPRGMVQHWWHPITGEGPKSKYSDDFLWLPFVTANYLKETGDFKILTEKVPFLTENGRKPLDASVHGHCKKAIGWALKRRNKRGLPLIGTGDWNDGLSVAGWKDKGESVWVAQFLYGILNEFCEAIQRAVRMKIISTSEAKQVKIYQKEAARLYRAINDYGWDGKWYWAASCDDGTLIGSRKAKEGKIHLNPQTWAVFNRIVPEERLESVLQSVETYLYRDYGPLVLYPAYQTPDERIGYLTRYAPGVRENGGLYTHAGTWAIQMECFLKRREKAWELFKKFCPVDRGMDPRLYQCEPYVTPGNVDGPDSAFYGRGGWTWYTGSAAWLYRIMLEWILGVRPEWEGLQIDPCVPDHWNDFQLERVYRGKKIYFHFQRDRNLKSNSVAIYAGERKVSDGILRPDQINSLSKENADGKLDLKVFYN